MLVENGGEVSGCCVKKVTDISQVLAFAQVFLEIIRC